jgi:hypothetical protein
VAQDHPVSLFSSSNVTTTRVDSGATARSFVPAPGEHQSFRWIDLQELDRRLGRRLVTIHATGSPDGFFWWAFQLMARQVRNSIAADLGRLRGCLES